MVYFMDTWVHFTVFCYILWTFGIVRGNFVYFSHFDILYQEKIWQPRFCSRFSALKPVTLGTKMICNFAKRMPVVIMYIDIAVLVNSRYAL
jgi:hypothetical protein